jgi:hypothetical protein
MRSIREEKRESADKPGSVVEQSFIWDARHRAPRATYPGTVRTTPVFPYLVLLRMGFTLPCLLPAMRCALTAPFHPYPAKARRYIFCGTFRRLSPPRRYLASCPAEPGLSSPAGYVYPSGATAWPTPVANITDMGALLRDIAALSKYDRTLLVKQGVNGNLIRCAPQQAAHGAIDKMMPRQKRQDTAPA